MTLRNKEGATLALTVTCTIFILMVGVGIFFLIQMAGGGREAQHATDAGNLNVAKQALKYPSVSAAVYSDAATGLSIDETVEFSGLMDSGNNINLSNYNRLVGKAFLVACNASAEGTTNALNSAQAVLDAVEGPGGVGQQLTQSMQSNLGTDTNNFFYTIAHSNSLRMLNWNQQNQITHNNSNYRMAWMRQSQNLQTPAPTNLQLVNSSNIIPSAARVTANYSTQSTNTSNNSNYLAGYTPIGVTVGSTTLTIYGVPMRPGLEPHTVSQAEFTAEETPPLVSVNTPLVPPNAFQSEGSAVEMHGATLNTRSSAIVGTLNTQYPAEIPNGYIAIDNSGPALNASYTTTGANIFSGELMGNGVYILTAQPSGNVYFTTNSQDYSTLQGLPTGGLDANGYPTVTASMPTPNGFGSQPTGADLDSLAYQLNHNILPVNCNNTNSFVNVDPTCANLVGQIQAQLLTNGNSVTTNAGNLMAVEYIKAQIIAVRGSFDSAGCGNINGGPPCTGLKGYTIPLQNSNNVPFGNDGINSTNPPNPNPSPTIAQLLTQIGDPNNGNSIYNQIVQRLYEMNPNATSTDIANAMNQVVKFYVWPTNSGPPVYQYLYWNGSAYTISSSPPPGSGATPLVTPDGNAQPEQQTIDAGNPDNLVDMGGDGGYPHPFDCEPGFPSASDTDKGIWTPSSGRGNLLGVIQFQNCASAGAQWCCPC